ncbi:CheR family methyltransferase [Uliginosibacterium paludis]|uniref:protein-glutamate O-methyltransferase n=1 Tax=Uliginosibacterium paludis TaxID=1615952 RepID=A0ABV2CRL0_9RHOO
MKDITDREFAQFQRFIFDIAGISLSEAKKPLVCGRLGKRLQFHGLSSYSEYFALLRSGQQAAELQIAVDLLTTNETYMFREQKHFDLLRQVAAQARPHAFRVWSAACSSGEETYSIAMVLADCLPARSWEVIGSDISQRMLERARTGHYPMERARDVPQDYLRRFCLRGTGSYQGSLLVSKDLRERVSFMQINLNEELPALGAFDVIFLRNVMIYFNNDTKRRIVERMVPLLRSGGYFLIGHSESLNGITDALVARAPAIYVKP